MASLSTHALLTMIESLTYTPVEKSCMPWASKVPYFQANPTTTFKPGLNIIFGPNGSGKSTLLKMLGTTLAAIQGGRSVVTDSWMRDLFGFSEDRIKLPCAVVHDGQPIRYFDARAKEGLVGGGFDDDFMMLGVMNIMNKGSTGQLTMHRVEGMLKSLMEPAKPEDSKPAAEKPAKTTKKPAARSRKAASVERKESSFENPFLSAEHPSDIQWKVMRKGANSVWAERIKLVDAMLAPKCAKGPQTLLFDEPESGFNLDWQARVWLNVLSKVDPARHQVIVATHSPFALGMPNANYIEMEPGSIDHALSLLRMFAARWAEK